MMKEGASPVDKQKILALSKEGESVKKISKLLMIVERCVKPWTEKEVEARAKKEAAAK